MRWFKHDCDARNSEGMDALFEFDGFAAQGRWYRLLEIIAEKMDYTDRCHVEYSISKWCSLLRLKQNKLSLFLEVTENKLKTKVVTSGNFIRIEIPNLLKKKDNHSKNLQVKNKLIPSQDIEIDIDKDKEKNPLISPNGGKGEKKPDKPKKQSEAKAKYAEFVSLTPSEHDKLVQEHGKAKMKRIIEVLDNYKGANGKKYKSDYRAILNWVLDRVKQDEVSNAKGRPGSVAEKNVAEGRTAAGGIRAEPGKYDDVDFEAGLR